MAADYIFDYLDDIWGLLPEADRVRFAETWKAYEQTYGDVWMQMIERQMGVNIDYLPLYNVRRWNRHTFNEDTQILRSASYRSPQDLSAGINLVSRYLIRLSVNGGPQVEVDLRGTNPASTSLSEIIGKVNQALGETVAFAVESNQLLEFRSSIQGPTSSIEFFPASNSVRDASEIILGLDPAEDLPAAFPRFPYEYLLDDRFIVSVPDMQDKIHDELVETRLVQGTDYAIEFGTGVISFAAAPPEMMWAKDTLYNKETPYNNYGFLLGIYDRNTENYLKAIKGLWYAFWTGPRPENIRRSLYLLFGLPTASQAGVVTAVSDTAVSVQYTDGSSESFAVPSGLAPAVTLNQTLTRFQPLVTGIKVYDKVNYPGFVTREVGRFGIQPFLTEQATTGVDPDTDESRALRMLEENTYLPQIDVATFISPDISLRNVRTFLSTLQPKSRTFLFQILIGVFRDLVTVKDEGARSVTSPTFPNGLPSLIFDIDFDATPNVDWHNNLDCEQSEREEAELNDYSPLMLDEGFAMGDRILVDVYQAASPIDSFSVEG